MSTFSMTQWLFSARVNPDHEPLEAAGPTWCSADMGIALPTALGPLAFISAVLMAPGPSYAQGAVAPEIAEVVTSVRSSNGGRTTPEASPPAIAVSKVREWLLRDHVVASGFVDAIEEVQVQPLIEGQAIEELLADVGDTVQAGQVLARLSASSLQLQLRQVGASRVLAEAQIAQSEASLTQATADAQEAESVASRADELAQTGSVPPAQAGQSRAAADVARARVHVVEQRIASERAQLDVVDVQVALVELQLSRAEVRAPVSGLVVERNAQVGAVAAAGGRAMFTLVRDGAMEARAEVSEEDLLRLAVGQAASLSATEGSEPLSGIVRLVEPAIDPVTRRGVVHIGISDSPQITRGTFLAVEILISEQVMLAVPVSAVNREPAGATVMVVRAGAVERVFVSVGSRDGVLIGIRQGLSEGDQVITKVATSVGDGDRVHAVLWEELEASLQAQQMR